MDLAQTVAQNETLTNAFVEGGRMRELVDSMAMASQALLMANQQSNGKKAAKKEKGLDIWQIKVGKGWSQNVDLEALD